jgi:hypothetical protein
MGGRAARAADLLRSRGFKVAGSCGVENYKKKGGKVVYPGEERKK